jgi:restriction system protein
MAIWLFRAGNAGQYESKFLNDSKVYLTWDNLNQDLSQFADKQSLLNYLLTLYGTTFKPNTIKNWLSQIWPMAKDIKVGDWIILPSKLKSAIHIGEVTSDYKYNSKAANPFYHY